MLAHRAVTNIFIYKKLQLKKILIANRGEIAIRVMKTAHLMGIKTVAVYSDADRNAPHVRMANEAVHIGAAPSSESYLVQDRILEAALKTSADAIHPGYGFLSENASFAELVTQNGITFIGPSPHAITIMGDKLAAKEAVKDYNIPMVPGIEEAITDVQIAKEIAQQIGFPILIKAAAGGGGKGMRVVEKIEELASQMERAISEATSAFGNGAVFIEKYVSEPRHIEIQILADSFGNVVHLFERECSIQRRHQKVIEEAPSSILSKSLRAEMGAAAIKVAKACNYLGAGTVEFLLDVDKNFYFLEMNTRLQVEHPVTEYITGIDLVEQQIKIARGEQLEFSQKDISIKGHSFEVRVYAEDPENNFLPSIGTLTNYKKPSIEGIRVDDGYEAGMEIPIYYDPMISKLVSYGKNRSEAIQVMLNGINNYKIEGIKTTLSFAKFVFEHEAFIKGDFDTHFIKKYYNSEALIVSDRDEMEVAAMVGLRLFLKQQQKLKVSKIQSSNWYKKRGS